MIWNDRLAIRSFGSRSFSFRWILGPDLLSGAVRDKHFRNPEERRLMKKILIRSSLFSLAATIAGMLVNLFSYFGSNRLLFAIRHMGGDCIEYQGFGLFLLEVYPMTLEGAASVHRHLSFDPVRFLITFGVLFAVFFVVLSVLKNKK